MLGLDFRVGGMPTECPRSQTAGGFEAAGAVMLTLPLLEDNR